MGRKAKYSKELKVEIVKKYLKGESASILANEYGLSKGMRRHILEWANQYKALGEKVFEEKFTNKAYTKEFKEQVIKEYLEGRDSFEDLANKHNISTNTIVVKWVKKYNSGIEINDYIPKGDVYKMKSRKTTIEERIEIVEYVLDNDNDYKGAADKYAVPYTNVYQWVKKYLEQGEEGLNDKRGRPSSKQEKENLSEVEKLQIEIESLKARNIRLERTIVALKKRGNRGANEKRFSKIRQESTYETIQELVKIGYTVKESCGYMEIPRSSYYKWLNREIPAKEKQDEELASIIAEYNESYDGILGYRRMREYINHFNQTNYSKNYIHRLMKLIHIHSRIRRKKSNYVKVKPEQVGENVLNRNFKADYPNQKWCTDVTEFKVSGQKQKLYLSAIIDLFDKSIVSYVLSNSNNNKLVFDTFNKALEANPGAKPIFHSDRGFQYTSKQFKFKLDQAGMIQSMSRVGKCIDNGPMEGFWGTLKAESFYGLRFDDELALRTKIEEYIFFYNNFRLQTNLKGMTPNEVRYHANCNFIYF